jgi:Domain of unknown function (DUF4333)
MSFSVRCAAAVALLAVAAVAAGCGESVIDATKAEDTIQASLEKSLHEKIKAVDCPSEPKVDPGTTFTCDVDLSDGKQATVTLKIRNKDADLDIVGLKPSK